MTSRRFGIQWRIANVFVLGKKDAPSCDIQCDTLNLLILAVYAACVSLSRQGPSCSSRVKQLVMPCACEMLRPCVATSFPLDAGSENVLRVLRSRTLQAKTQKRKVYRRKPRLFWSKFRFWFIEFRPVLFKDPQTAGVPWSQAIRNPFLWVMRSRMVVFYLLANRFLVASQCACLLVSCRFGFCRIITFPHQPNIFYIHINLDHWLLCVYLLVSSLASGAFFEATLVSCLFRGKASFQSFVFQSILRYIFIYIRISPEVTGQFESPHSNLEY